MDHFATGTTARAWMSESKGRFARTSITPGESLYRLRSALVNTPAGKFGKIFTMSAAGAGLHGSSRSG